MQNYVLGGGHTGLIAGFLTGFTVIAPSIGGSMESSFPLGPRILHNDEYGEYLLDKLRIRTLPKIFKIGYYYKGEMHETMSEEMQQQYFNKTRGKGTPFASVMSGGKNFISGWDMNEIKLLDKLKEKCNIIEDPIERVYLDIKHIVTGHRIFQYDNMINTLNIGTFAKLVSLPYRIELQSHPTTFVQIYCPTEEFQGFDYIYLVDEETPFHRITKIKEGKAVLELRGALSLKKIDEMKERFPTLEYKIVQGCQIVNSQNISSLEGIPMIGRYAQWNHSVKANDVIREVFLCNKNYAV